MQIGKISSKIAFKRALNSTEEKEFFSLLKQAKEQIAGSDGKSILIVHEPCLPQAKAADTGIGHLTSETSGKFFDFAKNYLGINTIEVLPQGEIQLKDQRGFYNSYNGSALSLGTQEIDLELLTKPQGKSLLSAKDFAEVVEENTKTQKEGFVNYENIVGSNSKQESALKKAFNNFINRTAEEKKEFEAFKKQNSQWLDRKALYAALKEKNGGKSWQYWEEAEKNLFSDIDAAKEAKIKDLYAKYNPQTEFYKFKQFLAEEHLALGRKRLNEKGMKLFGDCLIGFSEDEVWAFKDAFKFDKSGKIVKVGLPEWHIPALNFDEIEQEGSAAQKLLKMKVGLFAKRYDGIRFDCSWSYVSPKLSDNSKHNFGGRLLDFIENIVKQVKGEKYNQKDLIHEFEAGVEDFSIFDEAGKIKSFLKDRVKVISAAYMDKKYGSAYVMRKLGENPNSYIIGVGNHDPQPLRQIADNIPEIIDGKYSYRRAKQAGILRDIFNISFHDIETPTDFVKFKFAEPITAKNNLVFYMDVFGRAERFDSQICNGWKNYRYRIPADYQAAYQRAVESGYGYNPMDSYAKVFRRNGLDAKFKSLYEKLVKYAKILAEKSDGKTAEKAAEAADVIKKTSFKGIRKDFIGMVAFSVGLIAVVIAAAKKGLDSQIN